MPKKPNESTMFTDAVGDLFWYLPSEGVGYWHRFDGPAIIRTNGRRFWWIYGRHLHCNINEWMRNQGFTDEDFGTENFALAFKLSWV